MKRPYRSPTIASDRAFEVSALGCAMYCSGATSYAIGVSGPTYSGHLGATYSTWKHIACWHYPATSSYYVSYYLASSAWDLCDGGPLYNLS